MGRHRADCPLALYAQTRDEAYWIRACEVMEGSFGKFDRAKLKHDFDVLLKQAEADKGNIWDVFVQFTPSGPKAFLRKQ